MLNKNKTHPRFALRWKKGARSFPGSPRTKRSITWACAAACRPTCPPSKGESTRQPGGFKGNRAAEKSMQSRPPRRHSAPALCGPSAIPQPQAGFGWGDEGGRSTDGRRVHKRTAGNALGQTQQAHRGNRSIVNYMKPRKRSAAANSSWAHPEITWPTGITPITIPSRL